MADLTIDLQTLIVSALIISALWSPALIAQIANPANAVAHPQKPKFITSVHPVQMIVSAISAGITEPAVLVPPGSTPHEYSLKPSNIREISRAEALFWIGPSLETFLGKTVQKFAQRSSFTVVTLIESPNLNLINLEGDHPHRHADHSDHSAENEEKHAKESAANWDPHIWLDPYNASAMAQQIEKILSQIDPGNAEQYRQNLVRFQHKIADLDRQLTMKLMPLKNKGYFVFHDAYSYFEKHYGLNRLGEFSINESKPSVKKMMEIQNIIQQGKAVCIFSEPQFNPALIDAVIRGTDVKKASLDPLGDTYQYSGDQSKGYFEFMDQFSKQFIECLADEMG